MSVEPGSRAGVVPHPAGARGTLRTPTGDELTVQTFNGGEEVVLLVLGRPSPTPDAAALDPATLEYTTRRGLIKLHGEAVFTDPCTVRFHAASEPTVIQRRAFVRVASSHQIELQTPRARRGAQAAHTVDISGGGMLLFGVDHLVLGDVVDCTLTVTDETQAVTARARVVRIDANGRRGLQFERIDEADRDRLIRLVFAQMRTARAKTRGDLV